MLTIRSDKTAYCGSSRITTVASGATVFAAPAGGIPNATEAVHQTVMPHSGTMRWGWVRTINTQPAGQSLVFTWRKNGADQSITITVAGGSAAGAFSDLTNSFTFVAGDLIGVKIVQGTGTSAGITGIACYSYGDDDLWSHARTMIGSTQISGTVGAGVTTFTDFLGSGFNTTFSAQQNIVPTNGVFRNLSLRTGSPQPGTGSLVVTLQTNNGDSSVVITIAAGSGSGIYSDNTNIASISAGQTFNLKYVNNSAGTSALTYWKSIYFYG